MSGTVFPGFRRYIDQRGVYLDWAFFFDFCPRGQGGQASRRVGGGNSFDRGTGRTDRTVGLRHGGNGRINGRKQGTWWILLLRIAWPLVYVGGQRDTYGGMSLFLEAGAKHKCPKFPNRGHANHTRMVQLTQRRSRLFADAIGDYANFGSGQRSQVDLVIVSTHAGPGLSVVLPGRWIPRHASWRSTLGCDSISLEPPGGLSAR